MAGLVLAACSDGVGSEPPGTGPDVDPPAADSVLVLDRVNLVPMDTERVVRDRQVVVRNGRIAEIRPAGTPSPAGARRVDGEGGWLLPGLWDMHVHVNPGDLSAYVGHGVTTVRNMWGYPGLPELAARVEAGELVGPRIHSVSPGLDGTPAKWPYTQIVMDPAVADSVVAAQVAEGWTTLKLYHDLRPEVYDSLTAAARRRGVATVGHTPRRVPLEVVLASGQRSVEHLGGYQSVTDPDRRAALLAATLDQGVWNCPTLEVQAALGNRNLPALRRWVADLHEAGAGLLVGTDAGIQLTVPGASIHDELAHFVRAGLTPYQALQGATTRAAEFMGMEDEGGRIAPGLAADLLLVRRNPLDDVEATRERVGVVLRGGWIDLRD
jgi:imidazolonepropionase-like amidohydrolase